MNTIASKEETGVPRLILFVTGNAPRSARARHNLRVALAAAGHAELKPMEIDLLVNPDRTVSYSIFATPALLRTGEDGTIQVLYGDLSDEVKLDAFLHGLSDSNEAA